LDRYELLLRPVAHMHPAQILAGLSTSDVVRRVPGVAHNIVEITAHMTFWQDWFLARCSGEALPLVIHATEGWPSVGQKDWELVHHAFLNGLDRAVHHPGSGKLKPPIELGLLAHYEVEDVMAHLAQHNSHHLGQIVVLRQAFGLWPPPGGSFTW